LVHGRLVIRERGAILLDALVAEEAEKLVVILGETGTAVGESTIMRA
jgi:hypothetical protein